MGTIQQYRQKVEQLKGKRTHIEERMSTLLQEKKQQSKKLHVYEQAKEVIREVGMRTQEKLQYHISDITSLALEAVFPDPYKLEVEFVQRRNKTECDIYFSRGDSRVDPLTASGGGAVDVAAFALRIASWSLQKPHTIPTIILDEPMRFVSEDLQEQASMMLKEISEKLGIQFIIVTHEQTIAAYSDKVFTVRKNGKTKRSRVS
jgi:DNA repair exonuclease SbcCD ATPase subunit